MTMGFGIYEQSLLLLTNASEYVITKSKARELFLHHKTYKVRQNKRNSRKPLYSGHLDPNNGHWAFVPSCPLYKGSTVFAYPCNKVEYLEKKKKTVKILLKSLYRYFKRSLH